MGLWGGDWLFHYVACDCGTLHFEFCVRGYSDISIFSNFAFESSCVTTRRFLRGLFKQPGMKATFPAEAVKFDTWQTALARATADAVLGTVEGGEVPRAVRAGGALYGRARRILRATSFNAF